MPGKRTAKQNGPNIHDVANLANVSISLVSNVINHPERVAPGTFADVHKAMDSLNWHPSLRRRGPKGQARHGIHTGNLALIMVTAQTSREQMTLPTNETLFASLLAEANFHGFTLSIIDSGTNAALDPTSITRMFDGLLIFGYPDSYTAFQRLAEAASIRPTVWIGLRSSLRGKSNIPCDFLYYDNTLVGRIAANTFLTHGHRRAAAFSIGSGHPIYAERLAIFREICESSGIHVDTYDKAEVPPRDPRLAWQIYSGHAEAFLSAPETNAMFFASDDELLGVCSVLRAMGVDLSRFELLGCNKNLKLLQFFKTTPPSIDIHFSTVGAESVRHLLRLINGKIQPSGEQLLVSPTLD